MSAQQKTNEAVFTRVFSAPRELVWQTWTDPKHLKEWFGPAGSTMSVANMDFKVGGTFHYCLKNTDGSETWGKQFYREITPPSRIELIHCFSDAAGNISSHPMAPTWPRQMLATTTFEEENGRTTLVIRWEPYEATDEEIATFEAAREGMNQGWSGTFAKLDEYLEKIQK